jgi:hypothetical protein
VNVFFILKNKVLSFAFSKYNYISPSCKKSFSFGFELIAIDYPGRLLSLLLIFIRITPYAGILIYGTIM